ncbi:hypothetical protein ACB098_09G060600 [Castanea mollissima]
MRIAHGQGHGLRLEGKVALITGGASGIGEFTAKVFVHHGAKVIIADIQDELGHSVIEALGSSNALYVHCEVTDEAQIKNAVDKAVATYVTGVFLGIKHASQAMIPARSGSIISTSSISSYLGAAASHADTCSKHAVLGLTKNAKVEVGQFGIRVNCLSPYALATPLAKKFVGVDDETLENVMNSLADLKGVTLKAEDVANAALFLASDESRYVSGHNLLIDGGFSIVNPSFNMFQYPDS